MIVDASCSGRRSAGHREYEALLLGSVVSEPTEERVVGAACCCCSAMAPI
jgi:hypothetical protein